MTMHNSLYESYVVSSVGKLKHIKIIVQAAVLTQIITMIFSHKT